MEEMTRVHDVADGSATERWVYPGASTVVALAPHGGDIEPYTDTQALRCATAHAIPAWIYTATSSSSESAFARFHTPSTQIHAQQYPLLQEVLTVRPICALSFHGMSQSGIKVGGRVSKQIKTHVRDAVSAAVPDDVAVSCVSGGDYGGVSQYNIVNAVTTDRAGGIQIEQSKTVRKRYRDRVVDAVIDAVQSPAQLCA